MTYFNYISFVTFRLSTYLTFVCNSASYNFLWRLIPPLTSTPVDAFFTVSSPPSPAEEWSCTNPHLLNKLQIVGSMHMLIWKPLMRLIMVFVHTAWLASVKIKSVSSYFMISCVLLISAAIILVSVGKKGKSGKHPTVIRPKSGFETSS